jgi:hypothetical protein
MRSITASDRPEFKPQFHQKMTFVLQFVLIWDIEFVSNTTLKNDQEGLECSFSDRAPT